MNKRRPVLSGIGFVFGLIMILFYAVAGILLIFVYTLPGLPQFNSKFIGAILILYSAFRSYKLVRDKKNKNNVD